ncbi:hypothetical protein D3C85_1919120 [compost metagenome]
MVFIVSVGVQVVECDDIRQVAEWVEFGKYATGPLCIADTPIAYRGKYRVFFLQVPA